MVWPGCVGCGSWRGRRCTWTRPGGRGPWRCPGSAGRSRGGATGSCWPRSERCSRPRPFLGEGHRKVWARLRWQGVRTAKARVLRLMREAHLLAPTRVGRAHGPKAHDGTITTEVPDQMWGMDATSCLTRQEGTATVFVVIDHCASECIGLHAAKPGTRFEAVEPLRQGVRAHFRRYEAGVAAGLVARHDHG